MKKGNLSLTRRLGESVLLFDKTELGNTLICKISVMPARGNQVRLSFNALGRINILREELFKENGLERKDDTNTN